LNYSARSNKKKVRFMKNQRVLSFPFLMLPLSFALSCTLGPEAIDSESYNQTVEQSVLAEPESESIPTPAQLEPTPAEPTPAQALPAEPIPAQAVPVEGPVKARTPSDLMRLVGAARINIRVRDSFAKEPVWLAIETPYGIQKTDERVGRIFDGPMRSLTVAAGTPIFISGDGCRTYRPQVICAGETNCCQFEQYQVQCNTEIAMAPGGNYTFEVVIPYGTDLCPATRAQARRAGRRIDNAVYWPSPVTYDPPDPAVPRRFLRR
jgi:hypothetical protein